ncbi:PulJ/GspJ family protein [Caldinitratiruptor microaerophilus]|uniref:Uncharacterized protein n=1 Tax=Caldinitratiruptor microaerophilus TaxID=671077 RepID=A0AA35G682_9FIRM|nr:hypothetical protein [Caldinitratiruptor microaerophilus]BDG60871.1 hypothetical protein caldi_19610 [Caldinitratiruptor microaerophilus]
MARRLQDPSGIALIEVLVATTLIAILTPVLVRLTLQSYRLHEAATTRVRERERLQEVLDEIVHGFDGDAGRYPGLTGVPCDALTPLPDGFRYVVGPHRVEYRVVDGALQRQVDAGVPNVLMPGVEKVEASCDAERLVTVHATILADSSRVSASTSVVIRVGTNP